VEGPHTVGHQALGLDQCGLTSCCRFKHFQMAIAVQKMANTCIGQQVGHIGQGGMLQSHQRRNATLIGVITRRPRKACQPWQQRQQITGPHSQRAVSIQQKAPALAQDLFTGQREQLLGGYMTSIPKTGRNLGSVGIQQ
jgi:hypothetical protein